MDGITEEEKKEAQRAYQRSWYAKNKEKQRLKTAKWREANPDYSRQYAREAYAKNKESELARNAAYRAENREKIRDRRIKFRVVHGDRLNEIHRVWYYKNVDSARSVATAWQKLNPHKVAANSARRRATRSKATPAWAEEFFISEAYNLAAVRTKVTGISWHVDHVVPLRSRLVCGLHCEANLRVITGIENSSKGNRHWPDMP